MKLVFAAERAADLRLPGRAAPRLAARRHGTLTRVVDRARLSGVREAGESRLERRHLQGQDAAELRRRSSSPATSTARSWSRRRCRTRAKSKCAVLGNDEPEASVPGEVIPSREFYDYQAKYLDNDSRTVIPADARRTQAARSLQRLAIEVFKAVDGAGMARVDFLLARDTAALSQRDQHHPRLHDHQHVLEDVGGFGRVLSAAAG